MPPRFPMGCAKSHAVIAAEHRAVGRNRLPRPQFTVLRRKPSRYRESHMGNCIQPQQVLPRGLKLEGSNLKQRADLLAKDHWLPKVKGDSHQIDKAGIS